MTAKTNRPALRAGAALLSLAALPAVASAQEAFTLDPVTLAETEETGTEIATGNPNDSGRTALGKGSVEVRGDGSGDANTALTSLPNVQYRNDTDTDAGENGDDILDLKPLEFSISGGRVTENNIMLNGIGINSVTGNESPYNSTELSRQYNAPQTYAFYGLHSQTQFVPSAMVESVEIYDSNVSAEYGGFQGGVVNYKLAEASTRRASGKLSFRFQSDDLVRYHLGTDSGGNPKEAAKPDFTKREISLILNQPLGENTALIFGFGRRDAQTTKDKNPQYLSGRADDDSRSDFWRLGLAHDFDNGDRIELKGYLTDYNQDWDSPYSDDLHIDVKTRSLSTDLAYTRHLGAFDLGPAALSNVTLKLTALHQDNEASNDTGQNEFYSWYGSYFSELRGKSFVTDAFDDWCETPKAARSAEDYNACIKGGYGSRYYSDLRNRLGMLVTGDVWRGSFKLGAHVERIEADRSGDGFVSYTGQVMHLGGPDFICPAGDPACLPDQYLKLRITQDPYDIEVDANVAEAFFELDQRFGEFDLRAGARFSYDDVLENAVLAPRLSLGWQPSSDFSVVLGANRYYSDNYMAYAIHDAMHRGVHQRRSHDGTTGEVGDWGRAIDLRTYSYSQSGLKTPYVDEASLSFLYRDAWTGGAWRLKLIDRQGKDQFARSSDSSRLKNSLTNEGTNEYQSISLEYQRDWKMPRGALDGLSFYASGVWARRESSNNTYFGDLGEVDDFIWYKGKSYTGAEFGEVTGNLDIPIRTTVELNSSWKNGRYALGIGADVAFGYTAALDTDENDTYENPEYGWQPHDIYEDYEFDAAVSTFLTARVRMARLSSGDLDLNIKVANLFDDIGNRRATDKNPWMAGRSFYVGTTYSW
ncbi:TonB-dependent receptor plug domain-containing protein [Rhodovulum sulfidophilum]|uniref:TonB-dependent receptor plug domain-containing protein n=1 Tax=Rhodovulum sulfidophilum TaxID=35806 RepID=UPI001923A6E0|nr:TonB-dependent receptor plug domain-containing protein [Rhodovulum sulfidophilum]MBL3564630.1 TonB-dependent receptor plug domain-containing protein [Rhodovulum sulfidophilum]